MTATTATPEVGPAMRGLLEELYPICRSITGEGLRQTLRILKKHLPLELHEVPTGTPVLDWTIPREWNIRDAYVADASGKRVIDFQQCNLHVVNYSSPVKARMTLAELKPHLFSLPDQPDLIPYRTSYYNAAWGFCLSHRQLEGLAEGTYDVCIDSTLEPGALSYGELVLPGAIEDEILISTHVCHPSLADDNLSGVAISVQLALALAARPGRRHTIRFIYAPGTIGAITWLARNRDRAARIRHGLTLTCLGDAHPFTYKRTVGGQTQIDRAAEHVLATSGLPHQIIDFFPYGYDERQYNSPGFRLAVGSLMRGRHGMFPEYHTSGDNLSFVKDQHLLESFQVLRALIDVLEGDGVFRNLAPYGEPQLGQRGLYQAMGGVNLPNLSLAMLWVLNLSDGQHSLLEIARRAGMSFEVIRKCADLLLQNGLLAAAGATDR
jgi:aminopeptidase-like protein